MPQIHKHSIDLYPSQLNSNLQVLHLFKILKGIHSLCFCIYVYPEGFATCLRHCGHVTELKESAADSDRDENIRSGMTIRTAAHQQVSLHQETFLFEEMADVTNICQLGIK